MIGFLFGLAPGGVYPAIDVTTNAVRSYRTISPLPAGLRPYCWRYNFCGTFRELITPQALPGTLPYGARTFLHLGGDCLAGPGPSLP